NPVRNICVKALRCVNDAQTDIRHGRSTGKNLVTKQIEVAEMIYELDKRQLLRLWSVLSSFGEIRETKDPIIQSEILRRAQLVLTDFVFGLKRVPEDQTSTTHSKAVAAKR